jgi:hypothetical protein
MRHLKAEVEGLKKKFYVYETLLRPKSQEKSDQTRQVGCLIALHLHTCYILPKNLSLLLFLLITGFCKLERT